MTGIHDARLVRPDVRFEQIAYDLACRIDDGEFPVGVPLPTATALAERYGVARGTIRAALEVVEQRHALLTRQGRRWIVHRPADTQSFGVLQSFAQWAIAAGHEPAGRTVSIERGRAKQVEAVALGVRLKDPVLRCRRVRLLNGSPVLLERTTYVERVGRIVERLPVDIPSVTEVLERDHDIVLAHAEHTVSATTATTTDADLLGVRRSSPLLRVRRTGRSTDGRAFEFSDDRYLPDAMEISVLTSGPPRR